MAEKIPNARSSITYSIEFEPEKQTTPPPKFVTQYLPKYKSLEEIRDEQERASLRRKAEEQNRIDRVSKTEDTVKRINKKLGSYVELLSAVEKPTHNLKN